MKSKILKSGKNVNLVYEQNFITGYAGVFVIEYKNGNMALNTLNESEAIKIFEELENGEG